MTSNEHSPNHDCLMVSILAKYIPNVNIQQQFRVFFHKYYFIEKRGGTKISTRNGRTQKKIRKRERERV